MTSKIEETPRAVWIEGSRLPADNEEDDLSGDGYFGDRETKKPIKIGDYPAIRNETKQIE